MFIFAFMTFKWLFDENLSWKKTFDEWNCFIFLKKNKQKHRHLIILSDKRKCKKNFLPSNKNEART